ncbi:SpoIIE family protein phosphatase [Streptomyces sp. ST2-7A]|uniref:ATP-binding SpoIIE family protein phosphatase n=1 Tax=Streptomyces sp. ST2-7A TaxID=2907214 RepID=UPI001F455498|nr:SpoIIE family protein phosphatase [Streptomyces sp. ST2-7A]MCE7082771.1 SpoIIE family protein phosphatase [Streptomyces sp. ST2-7A]
MTGSGGPWGTAEWEQPALLVLDGEGTVLTATSPVVDLLGGGIEAVRGVGMPTLFEERSVWAGLVEEAREERRSAGRAVLRRPAGGRVAADVSVSVLLAGGSARFLVWVVPVAGAELRDRFGMRVATAGGGGVLVSGPRAQQRLELLRTAAGRIGGSLDVVRNTEELVGLLVPIFADLGAVDLTEAVLVGEEVGRFGPGTPMRRVAVAAGRGPWPAEVHQRGETFLLGDVEAEHVRRGVTGFMPDMRALRTTSAQAPERARLNLPDAATSFLVLPLLARGVVLGAVPLWRTGDRAPFDEADVHLAEEIGSRLALGLDNARRYTRERRTVEALQHSLLPRLSARLSAARTAGAYVPAGTAAGTGGSWYDVIQLSGTRVAFVVGRVAGHGVNAAGAMGRLRSAVQTLADLDPAPDELLSHLDDLVLRFAEDEGNEGEPGAGSLTGATCLYTTYCPVTRQCLVASAGHPPPLLAEVGRGEVAPVALRPGPPLGGGGEPFEPIELCLTPGDVLAFHSGEPGDGDGRDPAWLRELARAAAEVGEPPSDLARHVLARLRGRHRAEDLAVLLAGVRAVPPGRTAFWELPADPGQVARARALACGKLTEWGLADQVFATELIVSELVTNAIRYAGGPVGLRLIRDRRLICEISDPSRTQPHLRRARLSDEGGRGLFLVAQLANRWGSRYTPTGKTIWTEQGIGDAATGE